METFNKENTDKLQATCQKIESLCKLQLNGSFMAAQLWALGNEFENFIENPIVANSGILESHKTK